MGRDRGAGISSGPPEGVSRASSGQGKCVRFGALHMWLPWVAKGRDEADEWPSGRQILGVSDSEGGGSVSP